MHVYRLFTVNSAFYRQSEGRGFYDDGRNLNGLYEEWKIVHDEIVQASATTQNVQNELREVAFRKKSSK